MAHKGYKTRFPVRKLNRKRVFKRMEKVFHEPRTAGRRKAGISRRGGRGK